MTDCIQNSQKQMGTLLESISNPTARGRNSYAIPLPLKQGEDKWSYRPTSDAWKISRRRPE